jgi:hypothetical protein
VYGFVDWQDKDANVTKQLSMISPVHSWLNRTTDTKNCTLAGVSDGEDQGWLYYL